LNRAQRNALRHRSPGSAPRQRSGNESPLHFPLDGPTALAECLVLIRRSAMRCLCQQSCLPTGSPVESQSWLRPFTTLQRSSDGPVPLIGICWPRMRLGILVGAISESEVERTPPEIPTGLRIVRESQCGFYASHGTVSYILKFRFIHC